MTVAADLFPGGVNSPVRAYRAVGGEPPVLVRGEGAFVWDEAGRRYIDYVGAFGPLLLGHANRGVVEAIQSAAEAGGSVWGPGPRGGPPGAPHPEPGAADAPEQGVHTRNESAARGPPRGP